MGCRKIGDLAKPVIVNLNVGNTDLRWHRKAPTHIHNCWNCGMSTCHKDVIDHIGKVWALHPLMALDYGPSHLLLELLKSLDPNSWLA